MLRASQKFVAVLIRGQVNLFLGPCSTLATRSHHVATSRKIGLPYHTGTVTSPLDKYPSGPWLRSRPPTGRANGLNSRRRSTGGRRRRKADT